MSRRQRSIDANYEPLPQQNDNTVSNSISVAAIDDESQPSSNIPITGTKLDERIRWIHFVLGCAVLLPWNALITATPYFLSRLIGTALHDTFSSYLSISFTVTNFSVLAHATATSKQVSTARRIYTSTTIIMLLNALLTFSTWFTFLPGMFFAFVLLNGMLQATAGSYLQTAVMAISAFFGPAAMQAVMSGQAFVGVVVSGVQLLSAAASIRAADAAKAMNSSYDDSAAEARAARLFFGLSSIFLCVTLGAYAYMIRMPEYLSVVRPFEDVKARHVGGSEEEQRPLQAEHTDTILAPPEKSTGQILRVAKMNWVYELTVAYVFVVTLAVFPPITTSIGPVSPSFHPLLFTSVHFLVFNLGDLIGRYLCLIPRLLLWNPSQLLTAAFLRTLFIPLFLACNIQRSPDPASTTTLTTALISSDFLFFAILLAFGISNGYVCSMTMIAAPSVAHNPALHSRALMYGPLEAERDVDVAATVASFFLVGGLALGSAASFVVRGWICGCNPFKG